MLRKIYHAFDHSFIGYSKPFYSHLFSTLSIWMKFLQLFISLYSFQNKKLPASISSDVGEVSEEEEEETIVYSNGNAQEKPTSFNIKANVKNSVQKVGEQMFMGLIKE